MDSEDQVEELIQSPPVESIEAATSSSSKRKSRSKSKAAQVVPDEDDDVIDVTDNQVTQEGNISPLALCLGVACFPFTLACGCYTVTEREEVVKLSYGKFNGTEKNSGCHFSICFGRELRHVNTRITSLDLPNTKVADRNGNPLIVSGVVVYHVENVRRAALDVANVSQFILNEAQAVIKKIVSQYPYESHLEDGEPEEPSLKTESSALQKKLVRLLQKSANQAGVIIHSFQFNELSYAPEIAAGMLRRQQARAMLAARKVIVKGAVDLAWSAVDNLADKGIKLQPEERSKLVSNLLLVICSENDEHGASAVSAANDQHSSAHRASSPPSSGLDLMFGFPQKSNPQSQWGDLSDMFPAQPSTDNMDLGSLAVPPVPAPPADDGSLPKSPRSVVYDEIFPQQVWKDADASLDSAAPPASRNPATVSSLTNMHQKQGHPASTDPWDAMSSELAKVHHAQQQSSNPSTPSSRVPSPRAQPQLQQQQEQQQQPLPQQATPSLPTSPLRSSNTLSNSAPSSPALTNSNSSQQSNQQQKFSVDSKALEMIQKLQQHYHDQVAELGKRNTEAILNIIKTGSTPRALPPSYAELEARVRALESHNAKAMSVVKQLQADIEELRKNGSLSSKIKGMFNM